MKCCFIRKTNSVDVGIIPFNVGKYFQSTLFSLISVSAYYPLNQLKPVSMANRFVRIPLKYLMYAFETVLGYHAIWGPVFSQDTTCIFQTLMPTHHRSVNQYCTVWEPDEIYVEHGLMI
jgi:hypothetical protein